MRDDSRTRTEVRSPTRTSTHANTRGNFTSTVTGGAGSGRTSVTINIPRQTPHDTGFIFPIAMSNDTGAIEQKSPVGLYLFLAAAGIYVFAETIGKNWGR